jgi:pimeloyl-ACP methyl ester carboxylesterase
MKEKYIETTNGRIYYWANFISKEGPTVIFLHGLSSNHTTWDKVLDLYKSAGYNTIAPDLRGHGLSDKTRKRSLYKIPVLKEDIVEIIKHENLKNVSVVGYSYGGYVGIDLAINNPDLVDSLALISTNHASPFLYHWLAPLNFIIRFLTNMVGWFFVWQSRKKYYYFKPENHFGYWKSTFSGYATMPISIIYWLLSEVFAMDYRDSSYWIKCPTLIVTGEGDSFISRKEIEEMHRKIPNSKVVSVGSGHFVASHYQIDTAKEIIKFFKESK